MDLVINTFGVRVRSAGQRIVLALPDGSKKEYSIKILEKIIILRPSSISTGAVELALGAGVDIVYLMAYYTMKWNGPACLSGLIHIWAFTIPSVMVNHPWYWTW